MITSYHFESVTKCREISLKVKLKPAPVTEKIHKNLVVILWHGPLVSGIFPLHCNGIVIQELEVRHIIIQCG